MYSKFVKPFFPTFGNEAKLRLSHPRPSRKNSTKIHFMQIISVVMNLNKKNIVLNMIFWNWKEKMLLAYFKCFAG